MNKERINDLSCFCAGSGDPAVRCAGVSSDERTSAGNTGYDFCKRPFGDACAGYPAEWLYACGGDGTISEVANGIAAFDNAAMSCIPIGTGNDFAHDLGYEKGCHPFPIRQYLQNLPRVTVNGKTVTDIAPAPLALGQLSVGVSLRKLTEAYGVFINGGIYRTHLYLSCSCKSKKSCKSKR